MRFIVTANGSSILFSPMDYIFQSIPFQSDGSVSTCPRSPTSGNEVELCLQWEPMGDFFLKRFNFLWLESILFFFLNIAYWFGVWHNHDKYHSWGKSGHVVRVAEGDTRRSIMQLSIPLRGHIQNSHRYIVVKQTRILLHTTSIINAWIWQQWKSNWTLVRT